MRVTHLRTVLLAMLRRSHHALTRSHLRGIAPALALVGAALWLIHLGHDAVAATMLGFFVVVYQISSQARKALKQSRENEALKLKLEVYKDIIGISRDAFDAVGELSSCVRQFHLHLLMAHQTQAELCGFIIPSIHPSQLIEKKSQLVNSAIRVMAITETWQIIDQRMDIFILAIAAVLYDVDAAHEPYFKAAYRAMPIAFAKDAWTPPAKEVLCDTKTLGDALIISLMTLQFLHF